MKWRTPLSVEVLPAIRPTGSSLPRSALKLGAGVVLAAALFGSARAQTIYVASPDSPNGVSSYNIDGTLINASVIPGTSFQGLALSGSTLYIAYPNGPYIYSSTVDGSGGATAPGYFTIGGSANGMTNPYGLAVTSSNLFVTNFNTGNVFKYDLSSGLQVGTVSAGLTGPYGLAISGNTLFVAEATTGTGANTINGYNLSTFSNTPTITITSNLSVPTGLAVSGNTLYVANQGGGTIATFDATTGASINAALVSGLTSPTGITVYGSSLFVTGGDGTVKGFDVSTGASLSGFTTITGLSGPNGIVVSAATAVPEPSTYAAIAGVLALGLAAYRRRRVVA